MQKAEVINIRLPKEIVKQLDSLIDGNLYNTRSEIIRQFLREYVQEQRRTQQKHHGENK